MFHNIEECGLEGIAVEIVKICRGKAVVAIIYQVNEIYNMKTIPYWPSSLRSDNRKRNCLKSIKTTI